jgi:hypothetical protein
MMNVQLHKGGRTHQPHPNGRKLPACARGAYQAGVMTVQNERRYRWVTTPVTCINTHCGGPK